MDLRYVVDDQLVQVHFEGHERSFRVLPEEGTDIAPQLDGLSLTVQNSKPSSRRTMPQVRKVTWNTKVDVQEFSSQSV